MRLDWLPDVLSGFDLHIEPGWDTRGYDFAHPIRGILAHHTATPATASGDYPSLRIVRDGRLPPDPSPVPGPLSQLGLGRSGKVYIIASGRANHAGAGSWKDWLGNRDTIGIEAEHPGGSHPWTQVQYDAYVALCATLRDALGLAVADVIGHKEWAPTRKTDPTFNMDTFRSRVEAHMAFTPDEEHELKAFVAEVKALGSNMGFVRTLIPDIRKNLITADELGRAEARIAELERESSLQAQEIGALKARVSVLEGQAGAGDHHHDSRYVVRGQSYRIG